MLILLAYASGLAKPAEGIRDKERLVSAKHGRNQIDIDWLLNRLMIITGKVNF